MDSRKNSPAERRFRKYLGLEKYVYVSLIHLCRRNLSDRNFHPANHGVGHRTAEGFQICRIYVTEREPIGVAENVHQIFFKVILGRHELLQEAYGCRRDAH